MKKHLENRYGSSAVLYAIVIAFSSLLLHSCKDQEIAPQSRNRQVKADVYRQITDLGFLPGDIQDNGDHFLVEGDIIFYKDTDYSVTELGRSGNAGRVLHRRAGFIGFKKQHIKVRIKEGMRDFADDIEQAIASWNDVHSNILLERSTPEDDASIPDAEIGITIYNGTIPSANIETFHIAAEFPSSNGPGRFIRVNQPAFGGFTSGVRRYMLVHAIGHALGFRHTDESAGTLIPGSPTQDALSVMNGANIFKTWLRFSRADVAAIHRIFPAGKVFAASSRLYSIAPDATSLTSGLVDGWLRMRDTRWDGSVAMAVIGDDLYIIELGTLHRVNRFTGEYERVGERNEWDGALGMAAVGDGALYIISTGGCLYRVNPDDGTFSPISCSWSGTQFMAGGSNGSAQELFVLRNGTLYSVNVSNGARTPLNTWNNVSAMTYGAGAVYIVSEDKLWITDATARDSGFADAVNVQAMAYAEGFVWLVKGNTLFSIPGEVIGGGREVNILTRRSNVGDWPGVTVMASFDANL